MRRTRIQGGNRRKKTLQKIIFFLEPKLGHRIPNLKKMEQRYKRFCEVYNKGVSIWELIVKKKKGNRKKKRRCLRDVERLRKQGVVWRRNKNTWEYIGKNK